MSESNVKIYLLDARVLTYSISIGTKGSTLFTELCNDCPLVFPKYFGLEILDKKSNFKWLRHNSYVLEQLRSSNELQLAVKFYPMNSLLVDHSYTLYLFAVQIRMAVIQNYLYYSTAEIVKILAMSLKIEMPHPEGSPADSLFAIENFDEDFILSIKDAVNSEYLELKGTEKQVVLSSLLEYVLSINVFGSRIFECKIKIKNIIYSVVLNCSPRGISINDQSHLIFCFPWHSLLNIKSQDSNLQIQTRSDPEGFLIKFESRHFAQAFKIYCIEAKQFYEKEEIRAQELEYVNSRPQKRSSRFLTRFSNITKICSSNIEKNVDNSQMSDDNNHNTSLGLQNEPDWANLNNPLMLATRLQYNPTMSLYKDAVQDQGTITCFKNSKILLNCSNSTVKRLDVSSGSASMSFNRSHSNSLACISDTPNNNYRNDLDSEDNHQEPFLIKRYNSIAHLDNSVLSNNLHSISHSNPPDANESEHLQPDVHPEIFEINSIPKNHSIRITGSKNNCEEFATEIDNSKIVGNGTFIERQSDNNEPVIDYKIVEEAPEIFSRDEVIIIDKFNTEDIKQLSLSPELIESMKNASRFTCKVLKFLDHVKLFFPSISNHEHSAIIGKFKVEIYDKLMSSFHSFSQLFTANADNILVCFASFDSAEFFKFLNCIIISFTHLDQEIYRYCCGLPDFFEGILSIYSIHGGELKEFLDNKIIDKFGKCSIFDIFMIVSLCLLQSSMNISDLFNQFSMFLNALVRNDPNADESLDPAIYSTLTALKDCCTEFESKLIDYSQRLSGLKELCFEILFADHLDSKSHLININRAKKLQSFSVIHEIKQNREKTQTFFHKTLLAIYESDLALFHIATGSNSAASNSESSSYRLEELKFFYMLKKSCVCLIMTTSNRSSNNEIFIFLANQSMLEKCIFTNRHIQCTLLSQNILENYPAILKDSNELLTTSFCRNESSKRQSSKDPTIPEEKTPDAKSYLKSCLSGIRNCQAELSRSGTSNMQIPALNVPDYLLLFFDNKCCVMQRDKIGSRQLKSATSLPDVEEKGSALEQDSRLKETRSSSLPGRTTNVEVISEFIVVLRDTSERFQKIPIKILAD